MQVWETLTYLKTVHMIQTLLSASLSCKILLLSSLYPFSLNRVKSLDRSLHCSMIPFCSSLEEALLSMRKPRVLERNPFSAQIDREGLGVL